MSDSRSASWRGRNRVVVLTFVLLAAAVLAAPASAHRPHGASPGAAGLGDRLFPLLGNGGYDAKHYDLALSYASTAPVQSVDGFMTMRAVATQGLSRFNLDFNGDAVHRVSVNGRRADWRLDGEELVITPRKALRKHDKFKTTVTFTSGPDAPAPDDPVPGGLVHDRRRVGDRRPAGPRERDLSGQRPPVRQGDLPLRAARARRDDRGGQRAPHRLPRPARAPSGPTRWTSRWPRS